MSGVFWKSSLREDIGIDLSDLQRLPGMHSISELYSSQTAETEEARVDPHTYIDWWKVFFITTIATIGIAMASLSWISSITHAEKGTEYQFSDNNLAEQRTGLNSSLIAGFAILGLIGAAGLAYGQTSQMSLFKFWVFFPLLFWLWCGTSVLWSVETGLSIRRIGHLYLSVMGAFGIAAFLKRQELIWMAILSMFLLSTFGLIAELSLGTFSPWRSGYRFCGLGHPNETGMFGAVMCLAARISAMMEHSDSDSERILSLKNISWCFFAFGLFIVLLTKSRTTLFSLIVAMFVVQIVMLKAQNAWLFVTATAVAISTGGFFIALLRSDTYNALFGVAAIGRSDEVASLTGRLPLWEEILRWVAQKPLLGFGYGAYWTTKRVEDFAQMFFWEPPNGHSVYIDALVETGVFGLAILIAALVASNVASIATYMNDGDRSQIFAIGLINFAIVHGLTESSFYKGVFGPLWFAIAVFLLLRSRSESPFIEPTRTD